MEMVAVTRGGHGSLLVTREEWHEHPGIAGEGGRYDWRGRCVYGGDDALPAARGELATLNEAGNRWGSMGGFAGGGHAGAAG